MDKEANDDAFLRIAEVARAFDRQTIAALAAAPVDPRVPSLADRTVIAVGMRPLDKPTPTTVYEAVLDAARERDPQAVGWDEEDGVDFLADPTWVAADHATTARAWGVAMRPG